MDEESILMGEGCREMGEEVRGFRSTNRQLRTGHGDVKYSVGNGVATELICTTCGHEQRWGDCLRDRGCWVEGSKGRKSGEL